MLTLFEGESKLFIVSSRDSSFKAPKFRIISQVISADLRWKQWRSNELFALQTRDVTHHRAGQNFEAVNIHIFQEMGASQISRSP